MNCRKQNYINNFIMKISPQKKTNHKIQLKNIDNVNKKCNRVQSLLQFPRNPTTINKKLTVKQIQERCSQLHKEAEVLKKRRTELLQKHCLDKQQQELKECTFKPKINQNIQYYIPPTPFLKRQKDWFEEKTKKLQQRRKQISQQEIVQCTFIPEKSRLNNFNTNKSINTFSTSKLKIGILSPRKSNSYAKIFRNSLNKNQISPLHLKNIKKHDDEERENLGSTRRDEKQCTQRFFENRNGTEEQEQIQFI